MKASDLRPGNALIMDGKLYVVTQFQHVTPGNLRAFVQLRLRCIADGNSTDKRLRSTEDVETANLDRREMEYLYSEASGHVFMDKQTYDQVTISDDMLSGGIKYMKPNTTIVILFTGERAVSVELPKQVELAVTDTPPAIKGATATNQMKEAILETGLKTRVPPFINIGDAIKISTEDGSYVSRA